MDTTQTVRPPWTTKLGFWIILSMLSTACAEVVSGSMPWPFFNPWGIVITTPLYGLHTIVLLTILVRLRALTWPGLLFAGGLFGLYEAYITKVLFNPHFAPGIALKAGGVAWNHVTLLVMWWHPIMAFILPVLLAETFLTSSRNLCEVMPRRFWWWRKTPRRYRTTLIVLGVTCGMFTTLAPKDAVSGFLVASVNTGLLAGLAWIWTSRTGRRYTLQALLPGKAGLGVMLALLAVLYGATGFLLEAHRLPELDGHLSILVCYAVFIALLLRCRNTSPRLVQEEQAVAPRPPYRALGVFCAAYLISAPIMKTLLGEGLNWLFVLNWLAADTIGVALYAAATIRTIRWSRPTAEKGGTLRHTGELRAPQN